MNANERCKVVEWKKITGTADFTDFEEVVDAKSNRV
jgi:hypothetical protein